MNQTFYIDVDEEISSIIDRLYKSMSGDNYFVVPKRAIFLQSLVNMKLLKREATKVGKKVIIVTQDEVGTSMAQRAGIDVVPNLEGIETDPESLSVNSADAGAGYAEDDLKEENVLADDEEGNKNRLSNVGSEDFYSSPENINEEVALAAAKRNYVKSEPAAPKKDLASPVQEERIPSPINVPVQTRVYKTVDTKRSPIRQNYQSAQEQPKKTFRNQLDPGKEKSLERMYSKPQNDFPPRIAKAEEQVIEMKIGKTKKIFFGFTAICLLALAMVAAYLFIPSAKITIYPDILKSRIDANVHGAVSAGEEDGTVAIRTIDKEESITLSYDVSGKSASAGKKAHGTVVIYNEYSSSPQSLIATTRLETADGKIFRIAKGVTVPGTSKVGNETKPGAIEVEVTADQAGESYNIEPVTFTIPGFKDGPKYEKFSAKSSEAMKGGTTEGEVDSDSLGTVAQSDIDGAKEKTENSIKEKIKSVVESELKDGEIALPDAQKITITKTSASTKVGTKASSISYSVTATVRALVFSGGDAEKIIKKKLEEKKKSEDAKTEMAKVEYADVKADFENSTMDFKAYAEATVTPTIDVEKIKAEMLGKNSEQLVEVLKKYPAMKNANVEFQPSFISKVPNYSNRVAIEIASE